MTTRDSRAARPPAPSEKTARSEALTPAHTTARLRRRAASRRGERRPRRARVGRASSARLARRSRWRDGGARRPPPAHESGHLRVQRGAEPAPDPGPRARCPRGRRRGEGGEAARRAPRAHPGQDGRVVSVRPLPRASPAATPPASPSARPPAAERFKFPLLPRRSSTLQLSSIPPARTGLRAALTAASEDVFVVTGACPRDLPTPSRTSSPHTPPLSRARARSDRISPRPRGSAPGTLNLTQLCRRRSPRDPSSSAADRPSLKANPPRASSASNKPPPGADAASIVPALPAPSKDAGGRCRGAGDEKRPRGGRAAAASRARAAASRSPAAPRASRCSAVRGDARGRFRARRGRRRERWRRTIGGERWLRSRRSIGRVYAPPRDAARRAGRRRAPGGGARRARFDRFGSRRGPLAPPRLSRRHRRRLARDRPRPRGRPAGPAVRAVLAGLDAANASLAPSRRGGARRACTARRASTKSSTPSNNTRRGTCSRSTTPHTRRSGPGPGPGAGRRAGAGRRDEEEQEEDSEEERARGAAAAGRPGGDRPRRRNRAVGRRREGAARRRLERFPGGLRRAPSRPSSDVRGVDPRRDRRVGDAPRRASSRGSPPGRHPVAAHDARRLLARGGGRGPDPDRGGRARRRRVQAVPGAPIDRPGRDVGDAPEAPDDGARRAAVHAPARRSRRGDAGDDGDAHAVPPRVRQLRRARRGRGRGRGGE